MPQFNIPYNNWEDGQVAFSGQVLANFNAILSALNNGIGSDNIADNTVTDAKIGLRTIADTGTPADAALLSAHLNGLANRIKAITGESNWKTDPVKSLRVIDTAVNNAVAFSNTALSNSSTALSTANAANATAALAETKADAAVVTANTASSNASTALNKATQVEIDYTAMVPVLNQAVSDAEAAVVAVADKVSTEQMENYVDQVLGDVILGSVGQMEILGSYTAVGGETSFVISSTQYNTSLDRLHLSYDGLDLYEGINYTRSGTTINLWEMETGQVVHYQIRKNVFMDNTLSDGSLLINGSVNEAKLSVDVQNKLNKSTPFDFDNLYAFPGTTLMTLFDTPTPGDITEEIRNTLSNDLVASKVTKFDTPTAGQIQETLFVADEAVTVTKVTTFEVDGSITEVIV